MSDRFKEIGEEIAALTKQIRALHVEKRALIVSSCDHSFTEWPDNTTGELFYRCIFCNAREADCGSNMAPLKVDEEE